MSLGNNNEARAETLSAIDEKFQKNNHYKLLDMGVVNGVHEADANSLVAGTDDEKLLAQVLENCLIDNPTPAAEKQKLLNQLKVLISLGRTAHIVPNFK